MTRNELAKRIYDVSHLTGKFTLRSGQISTEYFDKYLFEADPEILSAIAEHLKAFVPENTDALAGLEMGGIPIVTLLSQKTGLPALFVRKKAKAYGTCKLAEGGEIENRKIVIVEDVITSGGQVFLSANDLRERGAVIKDVLCVIDRRSEETDAFTKEGLNLHALFKMSKLKAAGEKHM